MRNKMAECKICGKKYHACSSCGLQTWEYDYCCRAHYEQTLEGKWDLVETLIANKTYEGRNPELLANAIAALVIVLGDAGIPLPDWATEEPR